MQILKTTPTLEGTEYQLNNWLIIGILAFVAGLWALYPYAEKESGYIGVGCTSGISQERSYTI